MAMAFVGLVLVAAVSECVVFVAAALGLGFGGHGIGVLGFGGHGIGMLGFGDHGIGMLGFSGHAIGVLVFGGHNIVMLGLVAVALVCLVWLLWHWHVFLLLHCF